ncbi:MAG: inosine/xanthosine triphosphatase [Candidatus Micrarchaeia archaeon]
MTSSTGAGLRVLAGGTFDRFHDGHKALLARAVSLAKGSPVIVGVTSDAFMRNLKFHAIETYEARAASVAGFVRSVGGKAEIIELNDRFGPALHEPAGSILCVSDETYASGLELNRLRKKAGRKALGIDRVPMVTGSDFLRISSTRIREGLIDFKGRRKKPVVVRVGSKNPVKILGARQACKSLFGAGFRVVPTGAKSGIPEQPFGHDITLQGAKNRAMNAYKSGKCDYGIGLESGLVRLGKMHFDVQFCAVYEPDSGFSIGHSMGFNIPDSVVERIRREGTSLGDVMSELSGIEKIGNGGGAIYHLSGGRLHRAEMVRESLLCAMIPRIARYASLPGNKKIKK